MQTPGLTDFLIRTVLDGEFRELALADPDRACEGYALSDEAREVLCSRDERLLNLLSSAFRESWVESTPPSTSPQQTPTDLPATQALPDVCLLLSLIPHVVETADDSLHFNYEASLRPWTDPTHGVNDPQPPLAPDADGRIDFLVRIAPTVISPGLADPKIAYAATIQSPFAAPAAPQQVNPKEPTIGSVAASEESSPSKQADKESRILETLAAAVRQAEPSDRYERLVGLIRFLQTGEVDGDEC